MQELKFYNSKGQLNGRVKVKQVFYFQIGVGPTLFYFAGSVVKRRVVELNVAARYCCDNPVLSSQCVCASCGDREPFAFPVRKLIQPNWNGRMPAGSYLDTDFALEYFEKNIAERASTLEAIPLAYDVMGRLEALFTRNAQGYYYPAKQGKWWK